MHYDAIIIGAGMSGLGAGETIAPHSYADWHGLFVIEGSALIGDRELAAGDVVIAEPDARLHLYGKAEARPGRKMGHVNRVKPLS